MVVTITITTLIVTFTFTITFCFEEANDDKTVFPMEKEPIATLH